MGCLSRAVNRLQNLHPHVPYYSISYSGNVRRSSSHSFVTTPIFYVNAYPHLGHLYSLLLADAASRFDNMRITSPPSLFTSGTDEHGQKVQRAADSVNISVNQHCDKVSQAFRNLCSEFTISITDFIRTTEERHDVAVGDFWVSPIPILPPSSIP